MNKMAHCKTCGTQTMTMSGLINLYPDQEPYESGKKEKPRTDIDFIDQHIIAEYCEKCDEILEVHND